ncbi:hypothetical protein WL94_16515 [Burkholderia cepacia]|nr:hypothetical protein WL94_16515 [Burkholderia cepacia]
MNDLSKRHDIPEQTFDRWLNKFCGMGVANARRLNELELENELLKRLNAEQLLVTDGPRRFHRKK